MHQEGESMLLQSRTTATTSSAQLCALNVHAMEHGTAEHADDAIRYNPGISFPGFPLVFGLATYLDGSKRMTGERAGPRELKRQM